MRSYLVAFVTSALVAWLLSPLVRKLALRLGAVSHPGGRHVHKRVVPRLGGVAIYVAFVLPLVGLLLVDSSVGILFRANMKLALGLLVGGTFMCVVGSVDDVRRVRALYKLYAQIAVAIFAYSVGFRIGGVNLPVIGHLPMGIFALPVTVLWVVGIVNAVNLIDGLDGLAAGVVFFAGATNLLVAYFTGNVFIGVVMAAMLGAILGFLVHNFNPARIFMGDSGSYLLGYAFATSALAGSTTQKASSAVALLVPCLALGVPIFDTVFSVVRRFLERRPIFAPDRGHLHHRLLDLGLTHRRAVLLLYGVSFALSAMSIAVLIGRAWQVGVALAGAVAVLFGLLRVGGYLNNFRARLAARGGVGGRHTELLRRTLVDALPRFSEATCEKDVFCTLADVVRAVDFERVVVTLVDESEPVFSWARDGAGEAEASGELSSRIRIGAEHRARGEVTFGFRGAEGDLGEATEALLQLLVDVVERDLVRVDSPLAPLLSQRPAALPPQAEREASTRS